MLETKVSLAAVWVAVMLVYLLGDVLRLYSGDYKVGMMDSAMGPQLTWMIVAVLMVTPILMILVTIQAPHNVSRWANIIMAGFWLLFNLIGLPTYPGYYDKFLLFVSILFNGYSIWLAWNWV